MKKLLFIPIFFLLILSNSCQTPRPTCSQSRIDYAVRLVKQSVTVSKNNEVASGKEMIEEALVTFKECRVYYWEAVAYEHYGYLCVQEKKITLAARYFEKASAIFHELNYPIDPTRFDLEQYRDSLLTIIEDELHDNDGKEGHPGPPPKETKKDKLNKLLDELTIILEKLLAWVKEE